MSADTEADAGQGGTGAPPPTNEANRVQPGLTREYARPEIRVQWYASRCIHSAACVRALPVVFDPARRPWIDLAGADADAIAAAVTRCPTGALRYERHDGGPNETPPTMSRSRQYGMVRTSCAGRSRSSIRMERCVEKRA